MSDSQKSGPLERGQWVTVGCLTAISMLATIDKNVLSLLVGAIKTDLHLSDTQLGLVVGVAFAFANLAVSLPAGWLADRINRRAIVACGVAIWSVMAAACGAANSFGQLFLARAGVGIGEGTIPPAAYSLIRDAVPAKRRGLAFSIFGMAASVGSGLSLVVGGILVAAVTKSGLHSIPVIGVIAPWQGVLILIGLGGTAFTMLPFMFRDPGRDPHHKPEELTFSATLRLLNKRRAAAVLLLVFSLMHAMLASTLAAWLPAVLGRTFGVGPATVGPVLGTMLMLIAPIGLGASGWLMDRFSETRPNGPAIVAIAVSVALLVSSSLLPQAPSIHLFWCLEAVVILSSTVYIPVTSTVVARMMPSRACGKAMSIFLLIQGVFGTGLAPVIAAQFSDRLFGGQPSGLAHSLTLVALIYGLIALAAAVGLYAVTQRVTSEDAN